MNDQIIQAGITIVTLIVGALLGPFVGRLFERPKERTRIKNGLLESVHLLFNYLKVYVIFVNTKNLMVTYRSHLIELLKNVRIQGNEREYYNKKIEDLGRDIDNLSDEGYYEKLIMLEAKLLTFQNESNGYFNKETVNKIMSLTNEIIIKHCNSSSFIEVVDFRNSTLSEIEKYTSGTEFGKLVNKKGEDVGKLGMEYTADLMKILN